MKYIKFTQTLAGHEACEYECPINFEWAAVLVDEEQYRLAIYNNVTREICINSRTCTIGPFSRTFFNKQKLAFFKRIHKSSETFFLSFFSWLHLFLVFREGVKIIPLSLFFYDMYQFSRGAKLFSSKTLRFYFIRVYSCERHV